MKTKKKKAKVPKPSKKVPAKAPRQRETKHVVEVRVKTEPTPSMALVPATPITPKDLEPLKQGGKHTITKTWLGEKQILAMVQKTQPKYVLSRPAKGGGNWSYVPGWYVQKALNFVFGWNWDYEVVQEPTVAEIIQLIEKKIDQIWVTGKLTVKDGEGHSIVKTQIGRADIKFRKNSRDPLDIGNDLKAAHTDALKKCASLLGIASDIYGKHESMSEGYNVSDTDTPRKEAEVAPATPATQHECHEGAEPISQQEYDYSKRIYGKPLCREHQKGAKRQ
jgi:hypothetical protein